MFYVIYRHLLTIEKTFFVFGNDRPEILVKLENCVLQAIVDISEGKSREIAMDALYSQLSSLYGDLAKDNVALGWFDIATATTAAPSTPPPSEFPSSPSGGSVYDVFNPLAIDKSAVVNLFNNMFQGQLPPSFVDSHLTGIEHQEGWHLLRRLL